MSDAPRTNALDEIDARYPEPIDSEEARHWQADRFISMQDLARTLERENTELAAGLIDIAECVQPRGPDEDEITSFVMIVNVRRLLEFHRDLLLKHIEQRAKRGKEVT